MPDSFSLIERVFSINRSARALGCPQYRDKCERRLAARLNGAASEDMAKTWQWTWQLLCELIMMALRRGKGGAIPAFTAP